MLSAFRFHRIHVAPKHCIVSRFYISTSQVESRRLIFVLDESDTIGAYQSPSIGLTLSTVRSWLPTDSDRTKTPSKLSSATPIKVGFKMSGLSCFVIGDLNMGLLSWGTGKKETERKKWMFIQGRQKRGLELRGSARNTLHRTAVGFKYCGLTLNHVHEQSCVHLMPRSKLLKRHENQRWERCQFARFSPETGKGTKISA